MHHVKVGAGRIGNDLPLTVIAGPCQLEGLDHALTSPRRWSKPAQLPGWVMSSRRLSTRPIAPPSTGQRGPGIDEGLEILAAVKARLGVPVLTDVHLPEQCAPVAEVVDVLQIPAFLCRQTDLLLAAGRTGRAVNIKKGQFLAPWDMEHVAAKVTSTGNDHIMLTERGSSFGYNTLVADMRALPQMAASGYPVIMDATHAVQMPGGQGGSSGGQREFAPVLARAAVAVGVAGVFIETHPDPDHAPSDGPNMIPLAQMPALVASLAAFDALAKGRAG